MSDSSKPFFLQALDALKAGDRRGAAVLLGRQLTESKTATKNLDPVAQLAAHIGEVELVVEAKRQAVAPGVLESLIDYWGALATYGRSEEALIAVGQQPEAIRTHPSVLHVRGTIATQFGRFQEAQELFRKALEQAPATVPTWFALAMIKTFVPADPDIAAMERLERSPGLPEETHASLSYALGKAAEDVGEIDRAFVHYSRGAALRRQQVTFDAQQFAAAAEHVIRDFTADTLKALSVSRCEDERSLFVTGLPRSGTTLVEQILVGHSAVGDGAEVNLFAPALIPMGPVGLRHAIAYQGRMRSPDAWGEIGRDYADLIGRRFRSPGRVVDKSLGQSLLVGLILHALPRARIAWLRRSPDDVALSCFRTYFSTGLPWSWSLTDIADVMRVEDRLFEHWRKVFSDRILAVPYEDLVRSPAAWAETLQRHFGLQVEPGLERKPQSERAVGTASAGQVRQSISASRVGRASAFERHLRAFRDRYYR